MAGVRVDGTKPYADTTSVCYAGVARSDMTPPVGMYTRMWGAALHDCHTAVHKPLLASALAIAANPEAPPRLIVTLDLCLMGPPEMLELRAAIIEALGLKDEHQLVVSLSHTHAGPGILSRQEIFAQLPGGQYLSPYLDSLIVASVDASRRAVTNMEPVWVTSARASCNLACNRDTWDSKGIATAPVGTGTNSSHEKATGVPGQWVCGYGADSVVGPADDTLMVARICRRPPPETTRVQQPDNSGNTLAHGVSVDGKPPDIMAVLFNYGCHPTTLGPGNVHISPDYIGAARELVEKEFGGHAVFLQGASGDTGPMISYAGDPAAADRNGKWLGYAVAASVTGMLPPGTGIGFSGAIVSGANLAGWRETTLDTTSSLLRSEDLIIELPLAPQMGLGDLDREFANADIAAKEALQHHGEASVAHRDARAVADRWRRVLAKQQQRAMFTSADGKNFVARVSLMQIGDMFFVGMPGEPYQDFQINVRARCAGLNVFVAGLCNESPLSYTLPSEKCGCGTNQDEQMSVQPGSLELMIDRVCDKIQEWRRKSVTGKL
eukprot:m.172473 g.172473  ORF g.172473 m.172473 type:complete len:551 (+) comp31686_c0_seq1:90-1742(+)